MHSDIFSISGGGYHGGSGSSCTTAACRRNSGIIAGSIIGGIFGLIILVGGTIFCCKCCKGRPLRKNSTFANITDLKQPKQNAYDVNAFQSGIWSSRYFQYKRWHGPYQFSLTFDPQSMKVTGSGSDDVGMFIVDGTYSVQSRRMGLTKTYQAGTGNPSENLAHQVTIQLGWNAQNNQFEGKWYVQTSKYRGEDKFELKFDGQQQQQLSAYEKV
jgi:hypothetical protein